METEPDNSLVAKSRKPPELSVGKFVAVAFSQPVGWERGTVLNIGEDGSASLKFLKSVTNKPCQFQFAGSVQTFTICPSFIFHDDVPVFPDVHGRYWNIDKDMYTMLDSLFLIFEKSISSK